jgi:hypothetical protein
VRISNSLDQTLLINITDVSGKVVMTTEIQSASIEEFDISQLPNGVYFIKTLDGGFNQMLIK